MQEEPEIKRSKKSDLILGVYSLPIENLLVECCRGLREIVPFDRSFTNLNDRSNRFKSIFNYQSEDTDEEMLAQYADYYHTIDFLSWCYNQRQPMVFRATDLVYPEVIERSRIHREWESRMGVFYTVTVCIASDDILYGTISLMRSKSHGNFTDAEVGILDDVNQHLCNRFHLTYPNGVNRFMMDASVDPIAERFSLTPREWEVTCLLMHGLSRAEIAGKLCISTNTLKRHVANIYRKVGVSNVQRLFAALSHADAAAAREGGASGKGGGALSKRKPWIRSVACSLSAPPCVGMLRSGCCRRVEVA